MGQAFIAPPLKSVDGLGDEKEEEEEKLDERLEITDSEDEGHEPAVEPEPEMPLQLVRNDGGGFCHNIQVSGLSSSFIRWILFDGFVLMFI